MASSVLASAFALAVLAGCAAEPVAWLPRQDAVSLPKLEAARTRADHEEIAAWYEREAASADRQANVHLRMRDSYASPDADYVNGAFVEHCQNLVLRYQLVAKDNLALAGLHRRVAEEVR